MKDLGLGKLIKNPFREIVAREVLSGHFGCNKGAYGVFLSLSCGHTKYVKGSQEPKRRAKCVECAPEKLKTKTDEQEVTP